MSLATKGILTALFCVITFGLGIAWTCIGFGIDWHKLCGLYLIVVSLVVIKATAKTIIEIEEEESE